MVDFVDKFNKLIGFEVQPQTEMQKTRDMSLSVVHYDASPHDVKQAEAAAQELRDQYHIKEKAVGYYVTDVLKDNPHKIGAALIAGGCTQDIVFNNEEQKGATADWDYLVSTNTLLTNKNSTQYCKGVGQAIDDFRNPKGGARR